LTWASEGPSDSKYDLPDESKPVMTRRGGGSMVAMKFSLKY
jgi:hypothetical protein